MSTALLRDTLEYAAIGEAIQRICAELPEGWFVVLTIERDIAVPTVYGPNRGGVVCEAGETLSESIADALQYAQEHAKHKTLSVHQELALQRPKCLPGCYFDDCSSPNAWTVHAEGCPAQVTP